MQIYTTPHFVNAFKKLNKVTKHYSCLENHLFNYVFDHSFEPKGDLIRRNESNNAAVYKARLKSCTKHGKSYGFRLVYLSHPEFIILLEVYPKWGPKGADDIKSEGVVFLLSEALFDKETGELFVLTKAEKKNKLIFKDMVNVSASEQAINEEE